MTTALALVPTSTLGIEGDLMVESPGYKKTSGLDTAIRLSLFTDARAREGDPLPEGDGSFGENLRGWWASAYMSGPGEFGSRLWTQRRAKLTQETRQRVRDLSLEALQWLIDLGVAREIEVETEVAERGVLEIVVRIHRENQAPARYAYLWEAA